MDVKQEVTELSGQREGALFIKHLLIGYISC